jgi:hypothetical protein
MCIFNFIHIYYIALFSQKLPYHVEYVMIAQNNMYNAVEHILDST